MYVGSHAVLQFQTALTSRIFYSFELSMLTEGGRIFFKKFSFDDTAFKLVSYHCILLCNPSWELEKFEGKHNLHTLFFQS